MGSYPPSITFNGGTLQYAANNTFDVSPYIATIASGQAAIIDTGSNSVAFNSPLSGSGGLTKAGVGTLTLNIVNSFTGPTTVSGGSLTIADPAGNALAQSSGVTVSASATLGIECFRGHRRQPGGGRQREPEQRPLDGRRQQRQHDLQRGDEQHAGSAGSGFVKAGTGTMTLGNASTYAGSTVISGGVLKLGTGVTPGLWEGMVSNTSGTDTTDAIPHTSVQLSARWGTSTNNGGTNVYPSWGNTTTWGYAGYFYVPMAGVYTSARISTTTATLLLTAPWSSAIRLILPI